MSWELVEGQHALKANMLLTTSGIIAANKANDEKAKKALRKDGWKVITIWECRLKPDKIETTLLKLLFQLKKRA